MTKTHEIEALDEFIATLGTDSYLGPWLSAQRDAIERDIRADLMIQAPTYANWRVMAKQEIEGACLEARGIKAKSHEDATDIVSAAHKQADAILARAKAELLRLAGSLR